MPKIWEIAEFAYKSLLNFTETCPGFMSKDNN